MNHKRLAAPVGERHLTRRSVLGGILLAGGLALTGCKDSLGQGGGEAADSYAYEPDTAPLDLYAIAAKRLLDSAGPEAKEAARLAELIGGNLRQAAGRLATGVFAVMQQPAAKRPKNYQTYANAEQLADGSYISSYMVTDLDAVPGRFLSTSVSLVLGAAGKNQLRTVVTTLQDTPVTDFESLRGGYQLLLERTVNTGGTVRWNITDESRYDATDYAPPAGWPGKQPYAPTDLPTADLGLLETVSKWNAAATDAMQSHLPRLAA